MKSQLLEDFGDSRSLPAVPSPVSPPPPPQAVPEPAPQVQASSGVPAPRPRVWRARRASAPPVWRAREAAAPESVAPEVPPPSEPAPVPSEPAPMFASRPAPQPAADVIPSFASRAPDGALRFPVTHPSWFERSGRRLVAWGAAALLAVAVVGAGAWVYQDRKVAATLALVAGESTPAAVIVPYVPPAPELAPPLVLVKPGTSTPEPAPEMDDSRQLDVRLPASAGEVEEGEEEKFAETAVKAAPAAAAMVAAAPAPKAKPEVRKEAERKPTPRKEPVKKVQSKEEARKADTRKAAAKSEPRKADAKKTERKTAARTAPPSKPAAAEPALSQAETLRQCRAAGYHASQCARRGCVATRFGLACRG